MFLQFIMRYAVMIYLVCFCITLSLLLFVVAYEKAIDVNIILLMAVVATGNGGYYALTCSHNLEEAILANNMSYVIAIFAPLILFLIICNICHVSIPKIASSIMYGIQIVVYLCACTAGKSDLFYRNVQFYKNGSMAYLVKEYGPLHTLYLVFFILYTVAGIIVAIYSYNRRTVVSHINIDIILFMDLLVVGVYFIERFIFLHIELIPIFLTISIAVILIPLIKISVFSLHSNQNLLEYKLNKIGYIAFDKRLKFMGCNDYAKVLFPELETWELEKKIPAGGGKFNTFLRQPLMKCVESITSKEKAESAYEFRGQKFFYEIMPIYISGQLLIGYMILVSNADFYEKKADLKK
jgi:hypothetical protein